LVNRRGTNFNKMRTIGWAEKPDTPPIRHVYALQPFKLSTHR